MTHSTDESKRRLELLPGRLAICRLAAEAPVPVWVAGSAFLSLTRTANELSIVCAAPSVPPEVRCEPGWRCFRLQGVVPFTATGVLAGLLAPLAREGVSIFALSTFDTDYVMVKEEQLDRTVAAWRRAGFEVCSTEVPVLPDC